MRNISASFEPVFCKRKKRTTGMKQENVFIEILQYRSRLGLTQNVSRIEFIVFFKRQEYRGCFSAKNWVTKNWKRGHAVSIKLNVNQFYLYCFAMNGKNKTHSNVYRTDKTNKK